MGGVRYWEVSAIGRCPLLGGVRYWEVSAIGRCPLLGGVRYWEVSAIGRCPLLGGVRYWEVSAIGRCPLLGGVRYWEVSAIGRCPLLGGVRYWEVSAIQRFHCSYRYNYLLYIIIMLNESSQVSSKLVNFLYCQFVLVVNFTFNSRGTSIPLTVCAITIFTADRLCNRTFYRWPCKINDLLYNNPQQ